MSEAAAGATSQAGAAGSMDSTSFGSGVADLTELGLIRVQGADATSFLQAQLTNDVASLQDGEVRLAGYCSVKGRLMASFWVWRETAADTVWLACSRDIAAMVARRLAMFVLRAKAKVEDVSDGIGLLGILAVDGDTGAPTIDEGARVLPPVVVSAALAAAIDPARLETAADVRIARALLPVSAAAREDALQAMRQAGTRILPMAAWRRLEVLSGIARIEAANQELFVPQMVNFELVGGVNFRKGCYPGQEVVARSQYLGKLKRRAFLGMGAGDAPVSATDVFAPASGATEPVGQVVLAAPLGDGRRFVAFFESTVAAVPAATEPQRQPAEGDAGEPAIRIGASPITLLQLPYSVPAPAAPSAPARRVPDAAA